MLVGCFGINGPLRQLISLYRAVSQREGERREKKIVATIGFTEILKTPKLTVGYCETSQIRLIT